MSDFSSINQNKAADAMSLSIEKSLKREGGNRIDFANAILKKENGEQKMYYYLVKYKKKGYHDIIDNFETVFAAVRHICFDVQLNKD